MAAQTKSELRASTEKEFQKLAKLLGQVQSDQALAKDEDDTSIKDVVAHRAHWIELFLGWYRDGQAGKEVHFPAEGYKWNELKRYNADLRKAQARLPWGEAVSLLESRKDDLIAFIESHSDEDLYAGPMKGAKNDWRPGRWAEAAGPSHFRSAAKYIRQRLKAISSSDR